MDRWVMGDGGGGGILGSMPRFLLRFYSLRKKSANDFTSENELPVAVSLCAARSREGDGDGDGRANHREARSSYAAWVSRGFWPKKPKAHGAVGAVMKTEKDDCTLEEGILAWWWWWCVCS